MVTMMMMVMVMVKVVMMMVILFGDRRLDRDPGSSELELLHSYLSHPSTF